MKCKPVSVVHARPTRTAWSGIVALLFACAPLFAPTSARAQTLLPVCGSPFFSGADIPLTVHLTADDQRLFVPGFFNASIAEFDVATSGTLTSLGSTFASGATRPTGLATNPHGTRLYVASPDAVIVHAIAPDGTLTQLQIASLGLVGTFANPFNGIVYVRRPGGDFVYVNDNTPSSPTNLVSVLPVKADGTLGAATLVSTGGTASNTSSPISPTLRASFGSGARLFSFNGAFGGSNSISGFKIGNHGSLTLTQGSPLTLQYSGSSSIAVDAAGAFLYAGTTFGAIGKLAINPLTGALTEVPGSPFATGSLGEVLGLEVDPSGQFVVASLGGEIAILETDTMTPTASSPQPGDASAAGLAFDGCGTHLFAGNGLRFKGNLVSAYEFGDFAPLELSATVAAHDSVNTASSTVTLHGKVSRSLPTSAALHIDLEQTVGNTHTTASTDLTLPCGTGETPWTATLVGPFQANNAVVTLTITAVDPLTNAPAQTGPSPFAVRLKPSY